MLTDACHSPNIRLGDTESRICKIACIGLTYNQPAPAEHELGGQVTGVHCLLGLQATCFCDDLGAEPDQHEG